MTRNITKGYQADLHHITMHVETMMLLKAEITSPATQKEQQKPTQNKSIPHAERATRNTKTEQSAVGYHTIVRYARGIINISCFD